MSAIHIEVPAGKRAFLWIGESSVSEWVVPIIAADEEDAAEQAIQQRMASNSNREEAEHYFEEHDRIVEITELAS